MIFIYSEKGPPADMRLRISPPLSLSLYIYIYIYIAFDRQIETEQIIRKREMREAGM